MNLPLLTTVIAVGALCFASTQDSPDVKKVKQPNQVSSKIISTAAEERVLVQELIVNAPVKKVWQAFTTEKGWTSWSAPVAKIDFKVGGTIRSHYTKGAKIGDKGTITLHILNYVPERLLTLQAELQDNWPEVMKVDHEYLMNVLVFRSISDNQTQVLSYGVGYRNGPAYDKILEFFAPANEGLFRALKKILEAKNRTEPTGKPG